MTNPIFTQTYSSKSVAKRGAGRAGLEEGTFTIEAVGDRFAIIPVVTPEPEPQEEAVTAPVAETKSVALKTLATKEKSTVIKPVDFVHVFLDNATNLSRKEAIIALVDAGVNYSTARTQYQRWFTKNKKG